MAISIQNVSLTGKRKPYILDAQADLSEDSLMAMKTWNQKAREIMDAKGISIRALADTLDMTPGGVGHYLSGRRQPKPGMLRKLAKSIGVSVSELIEDDPMFARDQIEHDLLEVFREIEPEQKAAAMAMLRGLKVCRSSAAPYQHQPTDSTSVVNHAPPH